MDWFLGHPSQWVRSEPMIVKWRGQPQNCAGVILKWENRPWDSPVRSFDLLGYFNCSLEVFCWPVFTYRMFFRWVIRSETEPVTVACRVFSGYSWSRWRLMFVFVPAPNRCVYTELFCWPELLMSWRDRCTTTTLTSMCRKNCLNSKITSGSCMALVIQTLCACVY